MHYTGAHAQRNGLLTARSRLTTALAAELEALDACFELGQALLGRRHNHLSAAALQHACRVLSAMISNQVVSHAGRSGA